MCDWPCIQSAEQRAGMELREVESGVLTLINRREPFSHPVAAAAELNPQPAVGGDDGLGQLVAAKTTWDASEDEQR